jgi:hypothetical protein
MAHRIGDDTQVSLYPHLQRFAAMFAAALKNPVPPSLVAQKILEVAESDSWQLRHPVGPDALPLLQRRKGMTDEEWIDNSACDDETYYRNLERDFGQAPQPASEEIEA